MRLTHYDEHKKRWQINDDYGAVMIDELNYAVGEAVDKLAVYEDTGLTPEEFHESVAFVLELNKKLKPYIDAYEQGRLVILPCKVGDTVWFVVKEQLPILKPGIYTGIVTEIKAVQRKPKTLYLAVVEYEYPDPWYKDGRLSKSEIHCSFTDYGSWPRFYLESPKKAALKGETEDV